MLYLANASTPSIRAAMTRGDLGQMCTPAEGRSPLPGVVWGGDNGRYGRGFPGVEAFLRWLRFQQHARERCLFITAPDVVADAAATLAESAPLLPRIRDLGYPAALVAQDGQQHLPVPWDTFDALFVGGSTAWKLSPHAARLMLEAVDRGKHVHVGRVNTGRRWRWARLYGAHTVDGTCLGFGPDRNLPVVTGWPATDGLFGTEDP